MHKDTVAWVKSLKDFMMRKDDEKEVGTIEYDFYRWKIDDQVYQYSHDMPDMDDFFPEFYESDEEKNPDMDKFPICVFKKVDSSQPPYNMSEEKATEGAVIGMSNHALFIATWDSTLKDISGRKSPKNAQSQRRCVK